MYPELYRNKEDESTVYWFSSPYDALNNWSAHVVEAWGRKFFTLEHAYHFRKFNDSHSEIAEKIANANSPWAAMKLARKYADKIRPDWENVKVGIMKELVCLKHEQNEDVQDVLLRTGSRAIVENSPWDDFWGCGAEGTGRNVMGKIWMKVRDGE